MSNSNAVVRPSSDRVTRYAGVEQKRMPCHAERSEASQEVMVLFGLYA
ncbi:MAG: hypothetical protein RIG77_05190 [Cyclobacteriaceae bacterium]